MGQRILIVDDEPNIVASLEFLLARGGYEVCQRMRQSPEGRKMKIVMLTARGRGVDVEKGMALGADLYVTKPFSTKELVARVKELLAPAA